MSVGDAGGEAILNGGFGGVGGGGGGYGFVTGGVVGYFGVDGRADCGCRFRGVCASSCGYGCGRLLSGTSTDG